MTARGLPIAHYNFKASAATDGGGQPIGVMIEFDTRMILSDAEAHEFFDSLKLDSNYRTPMRLVIERDEE